MPVLDKHGNEVFCSRAISVGDIITAFLDDLELTVADLSKSTGIPEPTLGDIIGCRTRLTEEQAELIGGAVNGLNSYSLLHLQEEYYRHPKVLAAQAKQERKAKRPSLLSGLFRKAAVLT